MTACHNSGECSVGAYFQKVIEDYHSSFLFNLFCANMILSLARTPLLRTVTVSTSRILPTVITRRCLATTSDVKDTQNLVEKIVQKYALDLPEGYLVKSGDYVTIRPHHVLTHDNTGAVIPK